jgi:hypothetical protein
MKSTACGKLKAPPSSTGFAGFENPQEKDGSYKKKKLNLSSFSTPPASSFMMPLSSLYNGPVS